MASESLTDVTMISAVKRGDKMENFKKNLRKQLDAMKCDNESKVCALSDSVSILAYEKYVKKTEQGNIWTEAINRALCEHEIVEIPYSDDAYYIDSSIVVRSGNVIKADARAVIKKVPEMRLLMLRNENVIDESKLPASDKVKRDCNISVEGGIWDGGALTRGIYGKDGVFDEDDIVHGIYTSMLFSNVECLTVRNVKFINSPGFSIQTGNGKNMCFSGIEFEGCFADGLHINGNTENVLAEHIRGDVGDDIVALNMYDWDNSSINFGPMKNVWCEDVELYDAGAYKSIRILPGVYNFADGSKISCDADNIVLKNIRGINNFKLYMQTIPYKIDKPDVAEPGCGNNIFFEDISVSLEKPIDELPPYLESDPVTGTIAAFEFGANIKNISLENIRVEIFKEKYPYSYLAAVGPKSCVLEKDIEVFDPYVTSRVENLYLKDIYINGEVTEAPEEFVREIVFDKLYDSPYSSGCGKIEKIIK